VRALLSLMPAQSEEKRTEVAKVTSEGFEGAKPKPKKRPVKKAPKIGPNDPCPCGSGKKYKKCCGAGVQQ
jgi:preprotein translocase subunit SecA